MVRARPAREKLLGKLQQAVTEFTSAAEEMRTSGRVRSLQKTIDVLVRKVRLEAGVTCSSWFR